MRRNKCFYVFLTVGALLSLLSSSCLTAPATQPSVTTPASPVAQLQTDVATAKTDIATLKTDKASAGSITALETRMAQAEGNIRTLQSTSPANTYTKAEVDAAVAKAIADLKTAAPWGTVSSSSSSSGSSGVTTTIGGIAVTLDKTQVISTSTDTGNKDVTATIKNQSGASKNVSLLISLTAYSPSAYDVAKIGCLQGSPPVTVYIGSPADYSKAPTAKSTLSGFTTAQSGIVQTNPDVATLVSKIYWIAPNLWMDNGTTKNIWVNFDVKSVDVITWTLEVKAL